MRHQVPSVSSAPAMARCSMLSSSSSFAWRALPAWCYPADWAGSPAAAAFLECMRRRYTGQSLRRATQAAVVLAATAAVGYRAWRLYKSLQCRAPHVTAVQPQTRVASTRAAAARPSPCPQLVSLWVLEVARLRWCGALSRCLGAATRTAASARVRGAWGGVLSHTWQRDAPGLLVPGRLKCIRWGAAAATATMVRQLHLQVWTGAQVLLSPQRQQQMVAPWSDVAPSMTLVQRGGVRVLIYTDTMSSSSSSSSSSSQAPGSMSALASLPLWLLPQQQRMQVDMVVVRLVGPGQSIQTTVVDVQQALSGFAAAAAAQLSSNSIGLLLGGSQPPSTPLLLPSRGALPALMGPTLVQRQGRKVQLQRKQSLFGLAAPRPSTMATFLQEVWLQRGRLATTAWCISPVGAAAAMPLGVQPQVVAAVQTAGASGGNLQVAPSAQPLLLPAPTEPASMGEGTADWPGCRWVSDWLVAAACPYWYRWVAPGSQGYWGPPASRYSSSGSSSSNFRWGLPVGAANGAPWPASQHSSLGSSSSSNAGAAAAPTQAPWMAPPPSDWESSASWREAFLNGWVPWNVDPCLLALWLFGPPDDTTPVPATLDIATLPEWAQLLNRWSERLTPAAAAVQAVPVGCP